MSFYERLTELEEYKKVIENIDEKLILEIDDSINSKFKFRPYQKQALSVLHWVTNKPDNDTLTNELKDFSLGEFPIYGYEMATGSGKTILIGASIIYLHEKHNIKNFLILTPPRGKSAIYDKTIRNFDLNSKDCVLSNSIGKKFNLITGDNYTNKSSNYDPDADFNIFVFNVNKFFESSSGVKSVDKPWEESFWKDASNSVISFRNFLKQIDDLVILTDEAHHFQKFSIASGDTIESGQGNTAGEIVHSLKPKILIEFTATMIKGQNPIYRYTVNNYITDGYGKRVRAWGINTNPITGLFEFDDEQLQNKHKVNDSDAAKIIRAIAVHKIKKIATGYDNKDKNKKPILLIKARDIDHAEEINKFIKEELPIKTDQIEKIYQEISIDDEYGINRIIKENLTYQDLIKEIEEIGDKTFSFHTKNETKEIQDLFNELESNNMEIIVQVDKATEGWNIDNVYTILILSNNEGEIKINVKQLIGRGLRLFREKRIYDESEDKLKIEEELLHVVCEQGNNFGKFVEQIRQEIGLSSENFTGELKTKYKQNLVNYEFKDILKFNNLKLPIIERRSEPTINDPNELVNELIFSNLELESFVKNVGHPWKEIKDNGIELKWLEEDTSKEYTLETAKSTKEGTSTSLEKEELRLSEIERTKIIKEIIKNQNLLPSDEAVDDAIRKAIRELTDKYSFYFKKKYQNDDFWKRKFSNDLINHISKKIDMYFEPITFISGNNEFKQIFQEYPITIEYEDDNPSNVIHKDQIVDLLNKKRDIPRFFIIGYSKSYYIYNKFDSSQELKLAELLDSIGEVEMWVKNKRSSQFCIKYGLGREFNPDFIVKLKKDDTLYIIEIKAESLKEASHDKIIIMREANQLSKEFIHIFLLDKTVDQLYKDQIREFSKIIQSDDLNKL